MNRWSVLIGIFVFVLVAALILIVIPGPHTAQAPTDGRQNTSNTGNAAEKTDKIVAAAPKPGDFIESPLAITGQARGMWYFEASFPIQIKDASGTVIGQGVAQAHPPAGGDWMTTDFVPFTASVSFTAQPAGSNGTVVLKKDNPSGDPAHDEELDIPITFK